MTDTRTGIIASARELDSEFAEGIDGPGPYEGTDRELAAALDTIYGHGFADAQAGDVDCGLHGARVGQYVLWTDSNGFHEVSEYADEGAAQAALDAEEARQNPDDNEEE